MTDRTVYYEHPEVVPIIDGKISFFIPKFDIDLIVKVKQVKGRGTHDWIKLKGKKINEKYHRPMLEMLLIEDGRDKFTRHPDKIWKWSPIKVWKSEEILNKLRIIKHLENPKYKFIENNWRRPISEFIGFKILTHPQGNEQLYKLEPETARRTLVNGKFDK